jgi:hypothetical protein
MDVKDLVRGGKGLKDLIPVVTGVFLGLMIMLIVAGVFTENVSDGTISVPAGTNTSIAAVNTAAGTASATATSAVTTILGFVVLAVILVIFGAYVWGKSNRSKGMN